MGKFEETVQDALKAMKDAEVDISYYIPDPKKKHASAIDGKIYVNKKDAEKAAKKLGGYPVEMWPGLIAGGVTKYSIPKKYKLIESPDVIYASSDARQTTFIYWDNIDVFLKDAETHFRKYTKEMGWVPINDKNLIKEFLKEYKVKFPLTAWTRKDYVIHFNHKKTNIEAEANTHQGLSSGIVKAIVKDKDYGYSSDVRELGNCVGRCVPSKMSFWNYDVPEKYIKNIINGIGANWFKPDIEVETSPTKSQETYYYDGKTKSYSSKTSKPIEPPTPKKKLDKPVDHHEDDLIDMVRRQRWPGAKFESKFSTIYENLMKSKKDGDAYVELFKNPTSSELKDCDIRGVVDKDGNFYTYSRMKDGWMPAFTLIHEDLLDLLDFNHDGYYGWDEEDVLGVTVTAKSGDKTNWYLGESMFYKQNPSKETLKDVKKIIDKANKKQKGLKFHLQRIDGMKY